MNRRSILRGILASPIIGKKVVEEGVKVMASNMASGVYVGSEARPDVDPEYRDPLPKWMRSALSDYDQKLDRPGFQDPLPEVRQMKSWSAVFKRHVTFQIIEERQKLRREFWDFDHSDPVAVLKFLRDKGVV
ncbi:hypothetical protein GCM10011360_17850 [Primorskyibacter flagellatus]|uniref:Uncharacterized protein n=1 Tax=Primorskyibacter flagellatus TaxID=1387277 RepID=A0A917A6Q2_9RHOB|nr:hypothetical protein [Primorskyibacter flagellatus]GGE30239.1 hypothetical protein GCM10011360_17850 [Primorskyibacter flagellatus]